MFEDYLQDADEFRRIAEQHVKRSDDKSARRYFRASVFCIAASMEAFVNYLGSAFSQGHSIPEYEVSFLNDRALVFNASKGLHERGEYHRIDDKIKVLMKRFQTDFDFTSRPWVKFMEFKELRDSLVHSRDIEDETALSEYKSRVSQGLRSVVEIMDHLSKAIFRKSLRRQLLDLMPE